MPRQKLVIPNLDTLIAEYQAGKPMSILAKECGLNVGTIMARFREKGIAIRSRMEGQYAYLQYGRNVPGLCKKRGPAKGTPKHPDHIAKIAMTRYRSGSQIYNKENEIADIIRAAGFSVEQQYPVDTYNVDIALTEAMTAIEICHLVPAMFNKPHYTSGNRPQRVRIKHLCDKGWFVLYIIGTKLSDGKPTINPTIIRDELLEWLQRACQDTSLRGHYHIIWGNGETESIRIRTPYDFGDCPIAQRKT